MKFELGQKVRQVGISVLHCDGEIVKVGGKYVTARFEREHLGPFTYDFDKETGCAKKYASPVLRSIKAL